MTDREKTQAEKDIECFHEWHDRIQNHYGIYVISALRGTYTLRTAKGGVGFGTGKKWVEAYADAASRIPAEEPQASAGAERRPARLERIELDLSMDMVLDRDDAAWLLNQVKLAQPATPESDAKYEYDERFDGPIPCKNCGRPKSQHEGARWCHDMPSPNFYQPTQPNESAVTKRPQMDDKQTAESKTLGCSCPGNTCYVDKGGKLNSGTVCCNRDPEPAQTAESAKVEEQWTDNFTREQYEERGWCGAPEPMLLGAGFSPRYHCRLPKGHTAFHTDYHSTWTDKGAPQTGELPALEPRGVGIQRDFENEISRAMIVGSAKPTDERDPDAIYDARELLGKSAFLGLVEWAEQNNRNALAESARLRGELGAKDAKIARLTDELNHVYSQRNNLATRIGKDVREQELRAEVADAALAIAVEDVNSYRREMGLKPSATAEEFMAAALAQSPADLMMLTDAHIGQEVVVDHPRYHGKGKLSRIDWPRTAIAWVTLGHGEDRWYELTAVKPAEPPCTKA